MTEDKAFNVIFKLDMHQNFCRIYKNYLGTCENAWISGMDIFISLVMCLNFYI